MEPARHQCACVTETKRSWQSAKWASFDYAIAYGDRGADTEIRPYRGHGPGVVRPVDPGPDVPKATVGIDADGFAAGATVLLLADGVLWASTNRYAALGTASPLVEQVGYAAHEGGGKPYQTDVQVQWRLSEAGVERLEQIREGGDFRLTLTPTIVLVSPGVELPSDMAEPYRPIRYAGQQEFRIDAHQWAQTALQPWQQAAAVSVVVTLPPVGPTDEHRTVIARLNEAKRCIVAGEWKASVMASREAAEFLRKMRPTAVAAGSKDRTLVEREAALLDALVGVAQSLFNFGSAAGHPDPLLRDI